MKPDEFEQQLQRQPLRTPPEEWRREILEAANAAARARTPAFSPPCELWWREWLWPSPRAWAGLAAAWVIILALNTTRLATPVGVASVSPPPSREMIMALSAQRRELAELLGDAQETSPARKPAPPRPRSERQSQKTSV
jgi:hypothetical protein